MSGCANQLCQLVVTESAFFLKTFLLTQNDSNMKTRYNIHQLEIYRFPSHKH